MEIYLTRIKTKSMEWMYLVIMIHLLSGFCLNLCMHVVHNRVKYRDMSVSEVVLMYICMHIVYTDHL